MKKRLFAFLTAIMLLLSSATFAEELPQEDHSAAEDVQQVVEVPAEEPAPVIEEQTGEFPAAPVEELAEEGVPAEPTDEPFEEEVSTEPAEESFEEEEPAEEPAEEEIPAEEPAEEEIPVEPAEEPVGEEITEEPAEEEESEDEPDDTAVHFSRGYVRVKSETKVFKSIYGGDAYGVLANAGNVYAVICKEDEEPDKDWIELLFEYDGDVCRGYVKFAQVKVLDDDEVEQLVDAAHDSPAILWSGDIVVMSLSFVIPEAEVPEVTVAEEAATVEETEVIPETVTNGEGTVSEIAGEDAEEAISETFGEDDAEEVIPEIAELIEMPEGTEPKATEEVEETASMVVPHGIFNVSTSTAEELVIVAQPVNYTGEIGDTASFAVEAVGDGLTYQWKYRSMGKTAWTNASVTGAKTASMRAEMTDTRVKLEYCCFITDSHGQTVQSDIVCMEKKASFEIVTQPVNCEGKIGGEAVFSVEATGDGLTYQWKFRKKGATGWSNASMNGSKTATMNGEIISARLNYEYCCVITDASGATCRTDVVCMLKAEPLVIKTQPVNYVGEIGDSAAFTVEATGKGLTYQWKYRSRGKTTWTYATMTGSKTATMTGEMTSTRMKLEYCCFVTDAFGDTVQTDVVCMKENVKFEIVSQPVDYVGNIGDNATFTVEATGSGLTYLWKMRIKNKSDWSSCGMSGKTTANLSGEMTSARVKYEYCCFITDSTGRTLQTDVVCMKEDVKFEIVSQPVDYVGNIGDNATFTVEVTGSGLTYLWKYRVKGKTAWANAGMTGKTTAKMTGEMTEARLGYEYCCVIKDASGATLQTDVVCMKEDEQFEIVSQPVNYVGNIGDNATFTVEATGSGLTYLWKMRVKNKSGWSSCGMTGKTTANLFGEMTSARVNYEYCCFITDSTGKTLQTDVVCMVEKIPLVITEEPQDAVITGGDAVFTVVVTGNEPAYLWQTKNPGDEDWSDTACTADTFTVAAADCVNGMEVRCVVTDGYGDSITSATAAMTVLAAEITECVVSAENEVQLTVDCSAAGVEFRVIEVLDEEEILVTTSSETVITLQNVALGEHTYYVSVYYEGEDLIDTEPVSILCDKAKVNDVLYTLGEDQKLTVTGYTGTASSLVIPETVDGFTVTAVGASAFEGNTALHEIDLPDTITAIGSRAFKNCSNLSSMH